MKYAPELTESVWAAAKAVGVREFVPRVEYEKLAAAARGEPSAVVADRVAAARSRQHARFGDGSRLNSEMDPRQVREHAQDHLESGASELLRAAVKQLDLSARAFHRLLKLSRTIADLAGSDTLGQAHVAEAIQYRERVA